jgi:phage terminase large subunit GpA-like protein
MTQLETAWRKIQRLINPPRKESILSWAQRERRLTQGVSAIAGKFVALPYQRFLLEAVSDTRYAEHVWMIASQLVKTESINSVIGYFMDVEPCGIMVVYPTLDRAKDYSKKKLARMISSTRCLRTKVHNPRSRDSGNTVLSKEFPGGDIMISGANSPASLRSSSRRVVIQDEIDSYGHSAGSEGDPCALADTRAENFSNAVLIKASTPTIKGMSKIETLFEDSTKHRYHVPCPKCHTKQVLQWANLKWPEGKTEDAYYLCSNPKCEHHWTDAERIRAIYQGEWIAENPHHRRLGCQMSALYRLIGLKNTYVSYLHEFAETFLDRKSKGSQSLKAWQNTFLAESYEEEALQISSAEIAQRCEEYTPDAIPNQILTITAGVDVQKLRIEVEIKGWGKDEESWGMEHVIMDGDTSKDETWANLDRALMKEYTREDGVKLPITRAFVDMGYRSPEVLKFCAPRISRGIFPCRGINRVGLNIPPLLPAKPSRNNKSKIPHWNVGVTVAKTALYDRFQMPTPGPRTMHFPIGQGYEGDYFKQLTAEKRRTKFSFGQPYFIFEKDNNAVRNEALDLNVYAYAALASLGTIAWIKLGENLAAQRPKPEPEQPTVETKPELPQQTAQNETIPPAPSPSYRPFRQPRSSFVQRWR